jgi:ribokinase
LCFQPGSYQLKAGPQEAATLLKRTEVFACNLEEAKQYLGHKAGTPPERLLTELRALGPRIAVITDGRNGAYASDGDGVWHLDVIQDIQRVDTTGAGDAFCSGFVGALGRGLSLGEALRWGQGESSSVIQYFGAQPGLLHRRQLEKLLSHYENLVVEKAPVAINHNS